MSRPALNILVFRRFAGRSNGFTQRSPRKNQVSIVYQSKDQFSTPGNKVYPKRADLHTNFLAPSTSLPPKVWMVHVQPAPHSFFVPTLFLELDRPKPTGCGSQLNTRGFAGFGPCFHLAGLVAQSGGTDLFALTAFAAHKSSSSQPPVSRKKTATTKYAGPWVQNFEPHPKLSASVCIDSAFDDHNAPKMHCFPIKNREVPLRSLDFVGFPRYHKTLWTRNRN